MTDALPAGMRTAKIWRVALMGLVLAGCYPEGEGDIDRAAQSVTAVAPAATHITPELDADLMVWLEDSLGLEAWGAD